MLAGYWIFGLIFGISGLIFGISGLIFRISGLTSDQAKHPNISIFKKGVLSQKNIQYTLKIS